MKRGRLRVLLVDDEPAVRAVVSRQLEVLGWDVVAVSTGEEAIRVTQDGLCAELLLADIQLPGIDGVAAARAVRSLSPRTRVAFMSGSMPPWTLDPRDAPLLRKPFTVATLASAVARALRG